MSAEPSHKIDPDLDDRPRVHLMTVDQLKASVLDLSRQLAEERTENRRLKEELVLTKATQSKRDFDRILRLRRALSGLIGAETIEDLKLMELAMRATPAPEADKIAALNAIHALLEELKGGEG